LDPEAVEIGWRARDYRDLPDGSGSTLREFSTGRGA
jgi:hypothetical protein